MEVSKEKISRAFNNMPFEHRVIASNSEIVARINDLEILKKRVKENYLREIRYINERIKNYERTISEPTIVKETEL